MEKLLARRDVHRGKQMTDKHLEARARLIEIVIVVHLILGAFCMVGSTVALYLHLSK